MQITFASAVADIGAISWQQLAGSHAPFLRFEWLDLLERSGAVSPETGWQPQHLCVYEQDTLIAAMPLYLKNHSLGEYVFDQSWAQAYQRHGLDYYPKLVSCVPFTPVQGQRLLFHPDCDASKQREISFVVLRFLQQHCVDKRISSTHLLFIEQVLLLEHASQMSDAWAVRQGCQFHWHNKSYSSFEEFLDSCTSKRRKEIRRERRQAAESGLIITRLSADQITDQVWLACLKCYQLTNLQYNRHFGYLNPEAFQRWRETMASQLVVAIAYHPNTGTPNSLEGVDIVACAIFMRGENTLYGRYWGALEQHPALHFELCYYQGIEHCIEQDLQHFDPGAQGEHKVPRGFEPTTTYSLHYLTQPEFQRAVIDFVAEEARAIAQYQTELKQRLPFKQAP